MAKKKKVTEEVEGQTTFNEDDMSILYDDEGNVIECEDCVIIDDTEEVEEG